GGGDAVGLETGHYLVDRGVYLGRLELGMGDTVVVVHGGAAADVAEVGVIPDFGAAGAAERHQEVDVIRFDGGGALGRREVCEGWIGHRRDRLCWVSEECPARGLRRWWSRQGLARHRSHSYDAAHVEAERD